MNEKSEKYLQVIKQIKALLESEDDLIANLSNISSVLHTTFGFWWTGFYLIKGEELVLGPFQGPVACSRIGYGKGVCGTAWREQKTIIVPDVHQFPGHIACSTDSNSEIVVPVFNINKITMVLDIDSKEYSTFDKTDQIYLETIVALIHSK
jgi:GAF domain-containing protein